MKPWTPPGSTSPLGHEMQKPDAPTSVTAPRPVAGGASPEKAQGASTRSRATRLPVAIIDGEAWLAPTRRDGPERAELAVPSSRRDGEPGPRDDIEDSLV